MQVQKLIRENEDTNSRMTTLGKKLHTQTSEMESELKKFKDGNRLLKAQHEGLQNELERVRKEKMEKNSIIDDLKSQLQDKDSTISRAKNDYELRAESMSDTLNRLKLKTDELNKSIYAKENEIQTLLSEKNLDEEVLKVRITQELRNELLLENNRHTQANIQEFEKFLRENLQREFNIKHEEHSHSHKKEKDSLLNQLDSVNKQLEELRDNSQKKMINLKNKHTDDINKLNLEHFAKLKDLQKKKDSTECDLKDKLIDKQASKGLISTKEFNEKLKQKASITEFNLKKEFELKFKE